MRRVFRIAASALLLQSALSDFDDYVDSTFDCPATTTCRQVCVATEADCPSNMLCSSNETLCPDGSCVPGKCDLELKTPCAYKCAPVACVKVVDDLDSCNSMYANQYEIETMCGQEEEASIQYVSFGDPAFIALYCWISIVTSLICLWCAFNQRFVPVPGSAQPLQSTTEQDQEEASGFQTGYKVHPIGAGLHALTIATIVGFHGILCFLTIVYYAQQEALTLKKLPMEDEEQILKAFVITWMVGFVWSFSLKWPHSIQSIFLRRCRLEEATHVAVCVPKTTAAADNEVTYDANYIAGLRSFFAGFSHYINYVMAFIYSDVDAHGFTASKDGIYQYCQVRSNSAGGRYFVFLFRRYNLNDVESSEEVLVFIPGVLNVGMMISDISAAAVGLSVAEVEKRHNVVGQNIIEMQKPYFYKTAIKEFSKPFYTYQSFMVWSWFPLWYYYMAICWTFVILIGGFTSSYFLYRNESNLYKISHISGEATVIRDGETTMVPQQDLVPGDVVVVEAGLSFSDMVLVESSTTLVDESALTGEATPMAKMAIDAALGNQEFNLSKHKRHSILAGTSVLETGCSKAIVLRTASYTARGELIRDIYSYKRHQFKFDIEVPIVITILFFYAIFAFAMVIHFVNETPIYGWFYGIYVVGTVLPPLLPTVFTVAVGVSSDRLARKRITCTQSESILVAGKVTCAFFDKTGTLTEQGLVYLNVRTAAAWNVEQTAVADDIMTLGLAVCHSLTRSKQGELIGNPVDSIMFQSSGATFDSLDNGLLKITDSKGNKVNVVKHFDFDHTRMTQSVIVQKADGSLVAFVKGSAESVKKICEAESLTKNFDTIIRDSAKSGIYQISMASKSIAEGTNLADISREDVECNFSFAGLINFKNVMRKETPGVIRELEAGAVKSVIITGDSVLTGICIGREAGIIKSNNVCVGDLDDNGDIVWSEENGGSANVMSSDATELAVSGAVWDSLRKSNAKEAALLMDRIQIYGRCTPYDKVSIVAAAVELGYITMMCGDGGNDCGALKTAHVGVALSDAEASIVAPFTSLDKTLTSVVEVLKEGRCALASALASYKYLIMYGQVETINQLINAYFKITFTEWCWVFMDGIWTISLAFSLPLARAAPKLADTRPTASLLGLHTMSSVLGVLALNFIFTVSALGYLWNQDWFQCRKWDGEDISNVLVIGDNYESEVIFLVSGFQYICSAMAFNFGYEFRQAWIRNYVFVAIASMFTFIHFYITLVPGELSCLWRVNCINENALRSVTTFDIFPIQNPFNTTIMPLDFRRGLCAIMVANAIVITAYDYFVVNGIRRAAAAKIRLAQGTATPSEEGKNFAPV